MRPHWAALQFGHSREAVESLRRRSRNDAGADGFNSATAVRLWSLILHHDVLARDEGLQFGHSREAVES